MRIVIVDDSEDARELAEALLLDAGYEDIITADSAAAVFALLTIGGSTKSQPYAVDLVLLDILMPNKEGLETLIELKRRFPHVRAFAMSGGVSNIPYTDFLSVASKFGADAILRKPFDPQKLFDLIDGRDSSPRHSKAG